MGTALQLNTMLELTWTEADFLMHCIEVFANGDKEYSFNSAADDKELSLNMQQIDSLFLRIQDARSYAKNVDYEQWLETNGFN
jgi:hypothetical protein